MSAEDSSEPLDTPLVLCELAGPLARVTLNRPRQRNALSAAVLAELSCVLDACAASAARVVVLGGAGSAFSAGHDLRELQAATAEEIEALFGLCSRVMLALQALPQPVIARVHGVATAAGCQLVAACDLAVAAEEATFATPGVGIGLFCSTPAVPIVRAIGRKRALEMLLTGDPIDAATALDWGLVNRVVPAAELDAQVERLAGRIIAASADTVALGKRAFYRQLDLSEGDAYDAASRTMCANAATGDAREGIAAFLEKRRPTWRSR
jgi:enoyl-CoA hydratase/carnithine racemase